MNRLTLERIEKLTSIFASLSTIVVIMLALIQYNQNEMIEKRENAIDAINKVYNNEFLISLANIENCEKINNNALIYDMNLVFNTYYSIAVVYNNNIADNQIIEDAIKNGINKFIECKVYLERDVCPERTEIEKMIKNMNQK